MAQELADARNANGGALSPEEEQNRALDYAARVLKQDARIESYDAYDKVGGSRSWRNNNPGNIEYREQPDAIGVEKAGRFAKFATPDAGMDALRRLLATKYRDMSVTDAMRKYAPFGGTDNNNPEAYVRFLQRNGVDTTRPVGVQVDKMADAIKKQEGWIEGVVRK